jgi:hypothetical protein
MSTLAIQRERRELLFRGLGQAVDKRKRRFVVNAEGARWVVKDLATPEAPPAVALSMEGLPLTDFDSAQSLAELLGGRSRVSFPS